MRSLLLVVTAFMVSAAAAAHAPASSGNTARLYRSTLQVEKYSDTKPGNLLPSFLFQQGDIEGGSVGVVLGGGKGTPLPFEPDDSCYDDIFEGAMEDLRSPQLPYLTQDQWTCDRQQRSIDCWVLEDDFLKVTITPQFGGKIWSLYDKKRGKDLLYNSRAHQPANIAALKAWVAGGAEWNWSPGIIGHSAFSETQVFMARVDSQRGPVVRVYEFDRYNGTVWQVDMLLQNGSLLLHPRIENPTDKDLRGYWWTCVAVPATPDTRIFAPATHVAQNSRDEFRHAPWPEFAEAIENASFSGFEGAWPTDNSFLGNHQLGDMFLRIPKPTATTTDAAATGEVTTPYIAHTQRADAGFTLVHGHPLNGTKFFTWGQSGPGRFMQDFLAGGDKRQGDYTELQVGPAPTQKQNFPVAAGAVMQWTEWMKGFQGDEQLLQSTEYDKALQHINEWISSSDGFDQRHVADVDVFFESIASQPADEVLVTGQPWGALQEQLLGKRLTKGLVFSLPEASQQQMQQQERKKPSEEVDLRAAEAEAWLELLQDGTFSKSTLQKLPVSYQTTDDWLRAIEESAARFPSDSSGSSSGTWLHALHMGVAYTERGDVQKPRQLFLRSMEQLPNPIAARCLAVLSPDAQQAWPYFQLAWQLLQSKFTADAAYARLTVNLISEISFFLQQEKWYDVMEQYAQIFSSALQSLPGQQQSVDALTTMSVKVMLHKQQYDAAITVLETECFPTYAKARDDLMDMWNAAVEGRSAQQQHKQQLSPKERHQARIQSPIPDNIGCQYASEYCFNYW